MYCTHSWSFSAAAVVVVVAYECFEPVALVEAVAVAVAESDEGILHGQPAKGNSNQNWVTGTWQEID